MKKWLCGLLMLLGSQAVAATQLEIMTPVGNYMDFMRQEVIPEFQKRHPGVRVVLTNDENLDTRIAAGDLPDVYAGVFGYQPARYAKMGRLVYFDQFEGYDELIERIDPLFLRKNYGRTYYIPWNATTQLMIYNKELFREAGLDPDQPPRTWDEFLFAAEKISQLPARADGSPVYGTVAWNEVLSTGSWYWNMLAQMYYNFNGGEYQLLNRFGTNPVFDRPEANMAEFLATMKKAQQFAPMTMEKSFFSRTIGMWPQFGFGWKANFPEAADRPMMIGKDIGVAPIPTRNLGDTSYSTLDGRALMLFKSTEEKELLGWEFVQLLMEDELNHKANVALAQLPVLKSLSDREYYQQDDVKPFVEQLQYSLSSEPFAQVSDVANIILDQYSQVVLRKSISPEDAVIEAGEKARKVLRK
ncbi:extracellular solute-binding protein (plasmid) [Photobacterium sp. DA100]|uniref:extracellular solute-binding protein n=1 Tax=Photobacterium sp. DA100 TaxID=3027472 RepID=UPI00247909C8|nr:extracellular solute-binding protein [Photobacterium sp. DA100]WEM44562.1 extracellular solute-binding protein [Photobacterium sp. DA100]